MTEIEELKKEIQETKENYNQINKQLSELLQVIMSNKSKEEGSEVSPKPTQKQKTQNTPKQNQPMRSPRSDELIKLQSLTKGELCLSVGGKVVVDFEKYGDIKPILYSELVNVVNQNRTFAEQGNFYIMDERAVYHLGLSRYYDNLVSGDFIDNIQDYDDDTLRSIVPSLSDVQKYTISRVLSDAIYHDERVDHNKIELISKLCGIDIQEQVRQMREVARNMK